MGCLGRLGGCLGKIAMFGIVAVIAIMVIMALTPEDEPSTPDTNRSNPPIATTVNQAGNRSNSNSQSSSSAIAAEYEIVSQELVEPPNQRDRWILRVRMDANGSDKSTALGIAEAVREAEASRGATVFIVFAYSDTDLEGEADVGRGYTSDDGQGMAGDGSGLITDDEEGTIQVEVNGEVYTYGK